MERYKPQLLFSVMIDEYERHQTFRGKRVTGWATGVELPEAVVVLWENGDSNELHKFLGRHKICWKKFLHAYNQREELHQ